MHCGTVLRILVSTSTLNGAEIFYSSANTLTAGAVIYVRLLENGGQCWIIGLLGIIVQIFSMLEEKSQLSLYI